MTRAEYAAHAMLAEAVKAAPPQLLCNWLLSNLGDVLSAEELERLGNQIARQGHMKSREDVQ